jgi:tetratricopeptide (TPR) repeat protein
MGMPGSSGEVKRKAASGEPGADQPVFVRLASAYLKEDLLDEAIRICRAGLVAHPGHAGGRTVLASALLKRGSLDEAEAEFRRVLEQAPENVPALRFLGEISARKGQGEEARRYYVRALRLEPGDSDTQDRLAALAVTREDNVGEPASQAGGGDRDPLASQTLASLYASQGHGDVAEVIYSLIGGRRGEATPTSTAGKVSGQGARASLVLGRLLALREAARKLREAEGTGRKAGREP